MRILYILLVTLVTMTSGARRMMERFTWRTVDFAYPDEYSRQQAMTSKEFVPRNNIPVGIEVWKNKLFVSVPRWRSGVPSTLNYINIDTAKPDSPKLIPYPTWQHNERGNCENGLTSAVRIAVDKCGRLWLLDSGVIGIGNETVLCPYAIQVFDLNTDRRLRRYVLGPRDVSHLTAALFVNVAIDIGCGCEDTFAYFSDSVGNGLVVYSWEQNESWRFSHAYFRPDPMLADFNIGGLNFQWSKEGLFGMALSPLQADNTRVLYFSPFVSNGEFSVSTRILRNRIRVREINSTFEFHALEPRGPDSRSTGQVITDDGVMFFTLLDRNGVGCWNLRYPHMPENHATVDTDDVGLIYPSEIKLDDNQVVWVLSNRMPVYLESQLDHREINFRVYSGRVDVLIGGTVCETRRTYDSQEYLAPLANNRSPVDIGSNYGRQKGSKPMRG